MQRHIPITIKSSVAGSEGVRGVHIPKKPYCLQFTFILYTFLSLLYMYESSATVKFNFISYKPRRVKSSNKPMRTHRSRSAVQYLHSLSVPLL